MTNLRRILLVLGLAAMLVAGGLATASNMGLMFRASFSNPNRDYWLSLPYRSNLASAQDLCQEIGPGASLVSYFDSANRVRVDWACPLGTNFPLTPGRGVFVRVTSPTEVVFLGAHDPQMAIPEGGFTIAGRDYYISVPYHTTATVANDLCRQIPDASLISRFDQAAGNVEDWTCPFGKNFSIRVGEALRVRVREVAPGFIPEHF